MKKPSVLCLALCVSLSATVAFARGGMGSLHTSVTGGAFGTSPGAPGTNSLGTALSSSGAGNGPMKGPLLGTSACLGPLKVRTVRYQNLCCRDRGDVTKYNGSSCG
jgi:hypothetical protein